MSTELPPAWANSQEAPTSTVKIKGHGGDVVATIAVVGSVTVTTSWPYSYQAIPT